jgi:hypothetical protein
MRGGFPHEQRQNHCCQVGRRVAAAARIRQERERRSQAQGVWIGSEGGNSEDLVSSHRNAHRAIVAIRSSIKSRSTSQYLSDERRRLCAGSTWVDCSSIMACGDALEYLLAFRSPRLDLDTLKRLRFSRPTLIKQFSLLVLSYSPLVRVTI